MPTNNLLTGTNADLLIVAGGGGGGSNMGGGGGAGGTTATNQFLNFGSYNITIGSGGSGAPAGSSQVRGSNGTDSMIINTSTTATYSVMLQTLQSLTPGASTVFLFAGNFTVEGWIFRLATGDASMIVQGTSPYFGINVNAGTGINVYLNNATANLVVTDRVPAIQRWNHIALVRSSGIVKVYLNGVPSATSASNASSLGFSASNFYIGANNVTGGANQYISNVRVTNGTALYTNTFTPSTIVLATVTNTVLLACSSSTYTRDLSTSNFSLIALGAIAGSPFSLLWNPFNSTFTTVGGGGGASEYSSVSLSPASFGGSGGGVASSANTVIGLGITGQGTNGGGSGGNYFPGGGGGAVLVGTTGVATGAKGGDGLASSILGTTYYWGGGGGGSGYTNLSGNGGAGGGGGGAPLYLGSVSGTGGGYGNTQGINPGFNATAGPSAAFLYVSNVPGGAAGANTGGGGGGGSHQNLTNAGGAGGSGAVIIRYLGPQKGTGGTIYTYSTGTNIYTVHAFFSSAIFTLYPSPRYAQANGGEGGPYGGGGGGGAGSWVGGSSSVNTVQVVTAGNGLSGVVADSAYNDQGWNSGATDYTAGATGAWSFTGPGGQGSSGGARSVALTSGKYYFEVTVVSGGGAYWLIGMANSSSAGGYNNVPSIFAYDGGVYGGLTGGTGTGSFPNGTNIMFAYDTTVNQFWIGKNGTWYIAPTSTGTTLPGTGAPRLFIMDGSTGGAATGTLKQSSPTYTVPSGFIYLTYVGESIATVSIVSGGGTGGGAGGLGASGFLSNNTGLSVILGGSGGGVSTTAASGGGGGVDVYGITTPSNVILGGAANNPGLGGALFNLGGQPGTGGNGGLYGGGGSGAAVASVDTNTGNGASGALLIVYNTTASTYSYPSIMPLLSNSVNTASTTLLTISSETNKLLLTQFDNIVTSYQDLDYETLNTGNLVTYDAVDINVTKIPQSVSVLAGNLQIITYITDHEMMLKNSDKTLLATYDTPYNYQSIQEITPDNDPRLITVRVQNFVVGVTGSDSQFVTAITSGGQSWY